MQELENFDKVNFKPQAKDSDAIDKRIDSSIILSSVLDFQEASLNKGNKSGRVFYTNSTTTSLIFYIDSEKSSWELELTKLKQIELEFRQNQIIKDVDSRIDKFDADLIGLKQTRLKTETDLKFLEIRLVSLNQELCIVKDFERIENQLIDQVSECMNVAWDF